MLASLFASLLVFSAVSCENGVCRLVPDEPTTVVATSATPAQVSAPLVQTEGMTPDRIAQGAMSEDVFLSFLVKGAKDETRARTDSSFVGRGFLWLLFLAVLGGLALNLTPCVLPMIPVNLMVIGASPLRGLLYGLGQMAAFGALGLLAALGGVAFGTIQSSPWFNGAIALLLVLFALSLFGAFALDFTRFRKGLKGGAFVLGAVSALLAGACVAPVLASVLLVTAQMHAQGRSVGLVLPFAVGFGLALPWPFLGAGFKVLPKPGAWMRWVNRLFGVLLLGLAVHYGLLAFGRSESGPSDFARDLTVAEFRAQGYLTEKRTKPLLVYCHASWCKNCAAMERLMARSSRIRAELAGWDVVRLSAEDPNELRRLPGCDAIRGLPSFLVYLPRRSVLEEAKARIDALPAELPAITRSAEAAAKRIWENPWASIEIPYVGCSGFAEEMWFRAGGLSQVASTAYDCPQSVVLCTVRSWDDSRRFATEALAEIKRSGRLVIVFGPKADAPSGDWCDFLIDNHAPSGAAREGNVSAIANCTLGWAWACEYAAAFTRLAGKFPAITRSVAPRDHWIYDAGTRSPHWLPRLRDCPVKIAAGELGGYYLKRVQKMVRDFSEPYIRDAIDAAAKTVAARIAAGRRVAVGGLGHFIIFEATEDIRSPMLGITVCGLTPDVYGEILDRGDLLVWIAYDGMNSWRDDYNAPILDAGIDLIAAYTETVPGPRPKNLVNFIPQPWDLPDAEVPIPVSPGVMAPASEISRCLTLRILDEAVLRELGGRAYPKTTPCRKWAAYDSGMRRLGRNGKRTSSGWLPLHFPYADVVWSDGVRRGTWMRPWATNAPPVCRVAGAAREDAWGADRILFMTRDHRWGLATTNGQILAAAEWDNLAPLDAKTLACEKAARYGFMSKDGRAGPLAWDLIDTPDENKPGFVLVATNRLYGLWDLAAGRLAKEVRFPTGNLDDPYAPSNPKLKTRWTLPGEWEFVAAPNANGLHPVVKGGKWGVADKAGRVVVACEWDYVSPSANPALGFEVGRGGAWRHDVAEFPCLFGAKWGALGADGKVLLEPVYDGVITDGGRWVGATCKTPARMLP